MTATIPSNGFGYWCGPLAELWRCDGPLAEVLGILAAACSRFSEGFDTADLLGARQLIAEWSSPLQRPLLATPGTRRLLTNYQQSLTSLPRASRSVDGQASCA
jgi:hypothetical protein